jgi:hypothetical protein
MGHGDGFPPDSSIVDRRQRRGSWAAERALVPQIHVTPPHTPSAPNGLAAAPELNPNSIRRLRRITAGEAARVRGLWCRTPPERRLPTWQVAE